MCDRRGCCALLQFWNAKVFILHLFHPRLLEVATEENKLGFVGGGDSWSLMAVVASCEFNVLPAFTHKALKGRVKNVVLLIHFEKGHDTVADRDTERQNPDAPVDNGGEGSSLDGEKGGDDQRSDCNRYA